MEGEGLNVDAMMETASELVSAWGLKVVGAIAVLIVGFLVARIIRGSVRKALQRSKLDPTLVPFISKLVYYLVIAFVLVAVLGLFGIETTSFIAVLGAVGFAIGLALQGTLSNFSAGVMLLFFRPFGVGDYVEAGGTAGSVKEIGVFATTLCTPDNVMIIVPNSAVYGSIIKNYAANPTRRNDMVMGISYDDDIAKAISVIEKCLSEESRVLQDPAPVVAVAELADSSVNIVVRPWCTKEDYWGMRFDLLRKMKEELEAAGCSIPYPQTDVHVHNPGTAA
jgi:small conductance mechanosensitive channel